jgi:hypothetical protein
MLSDYSTSPMLCCPVCRRSVPVCLCPACPRCGVKGDPACYFAGGHWPDEAISRAMSRQEKAESGKDRVAFDREQAALEASDGSR